MSSYILDFPEYNLVYFAVPKAANTSIRTFLSPLTGDLKSYDNIHQRLNWKTVGKAFFKEERKRSFSFAVTRNPFTRIVSAYNNKICGDKIHPPMEKLGFWHHMPFLDFVELIARISDRDLDIHLMSQWALLSMRGELLPNMLLDMSEVKKVAFFVQSWVSSQGGPELGKVPSLNQSEMNETMEALVTSGFEKTIENRAERDRFKTLIQARFRRDLDLFGYEYPF